MLQTTVRTTDPATSYAAAARVGEFRNAHHALILAVLERGPATIHEVAYADLNGLDHVAVARRMPELERLGLVRRTSETRPSPSGRQATVWARA